MQIESFRIRKYRNIQDSGEISLENLTCIVGKNQSGKTALLSALYKFNPYEPEPYDIRREWPGGERRHKDSSQIVCEVKFLLDQDEMEELAKLTSEKMTIKRVIVTKDYEGNFEVHSPDNPNQFPDKLHPNDIDELCNMMPEQTEPVGEKFREVAWECVEEIRRLSREGRYGELSSLKDAHEEILRSVITEGTLEPQHQNENQFLREYISRLSGIENEIHNKPTMHRKAHEYVVERIPTFIYMDDYREFQGAAPLEPLQSRRNKNQLTPEDETLIMLLELSGLDLDELILQGQSENSEIIRERQYDLEDAARSLTKEISGRWGQAPYRIQFRVDGQKFFTEIEETNKDIGMIPLEEQAKGFRWFFSFDLRFMHDSQGTFEGCVLLLDEPGLHLHPGGQKDLLDRLKTYAAENALFYTTHLPFLIDLREPNRIRIINQTKNGAVVSEDLGVSGPDEKMTLQAALGMTMSQSYFVALRNLVVESMDDYMIIAELSNLFERSGLPGLPEDAQLTAGGGASEAVYMATFMVGQGLEVVALFNSNKEGRIQEEKLRKQWLTRYKNSKSDTLLLGHAVGLDETKDFATEDLFPDGYYFEKVVQSHEKKMRDANMKKIAFSGRGLLCDRVAATFEEAGLQFNKGSTAKLIRKEIVRMKTVDELPEGSKEKTEKLLKGITEKFEGVRIFV